MVWAFISVGLKQLRSLYSCHSYWPAESERILPEPGEQAAGDILNNPEVGGQEEHDEDKAGHEGGGEEPAKQVEHHRQHLEQQVQEDDQTVGGPATPLQHQPTIKKTVPQDDGPFCKYFSD